MSFTDFIKFTKDFQFSAALQISSFQIAEIFLASGFSQDNSTFGVGGMPLGTSGTWGMGNNSMAHSSPNKTIAAGWPSPQQRRAHTVHKRSISNGSRPDMGEMSMLNASSTHNRHDEKHHHRSSTPVSTRTHLVFPKFLDAIARIAIVALDDLYAEVDSTDKVKATLQHMGRTLNR
jgi:hypothetical protein